MLGELVNCKKREERKKGRRRTSPSRVGRIIGFEADGRLKVHIRNSRAEMKRGDTKQKDETYRKDNWACFSRKELSVMKGMQSDSDDEHALNESSDPGFTSERKKKKYENNVRANKHFCTTYI